MVRRKKLTRFRTRMRIECVFSDARRQGLLEELVVVLVLLLHLSLPALPHAVPYVTLEPKTQCHHWVTNTEKQRGKRSCKDVVQIFGASL